ncbi:MAG TPA: PAS domain-containing protein [Pseudolabrys sp.]|jgi:hypothetical protein|nr:PAS domain-containing protein [Pseudolabrys sp.]
MKHPSTRALYAYWDERRGQRPAPEREDIDPVAIRHVLGDTFMLGADSADEPRFRLAGTRVCTLFCRELKGEPFVGIWGEASRTHITDLLGSVMRHSIGFVASVTGHAADGAPADLEMLLLPLSAGGRERTRALGVLCTNETPYWIGESPLGPLNLVDLRRAGSDEKIAPATSSEAVPASVQLRHGFVVYRGGRDQPSQRGRTG